MMPRARSSSCRSDERIDRTEIVRSSLKGHGPPSAVRFSMSKAIKDQRPCGMGSGRLEGLNGNRIPNASKSPDRKSLRTSISNLSSSDSSERSQRSCSGEDSFGHSGGSPDDLLFAYMLPDIPEPKYPSGAIPSEDKIHGFVVQTGKQLGLDFGQFGLGRAASAPRIANWLLQCLGHLIDTTCAPGRTARAPN